MKHLLYLRYVARHKLFVYQHGRRLGVPALQLLVHDWHKLLPVEWFPYVETFYGSHPDDAETKHDFEMAWLHHQKRGKHHWQYWVLPLDDGDVRTLPMPDRYRREMVADWHGAGQALDKPDTLGWYTANREHMTLHPETRAWVESELGYHG